MTRHPPPPTLVPPPAQLTWLDPYFSLPTTGLIVIDAPDSQSLLFTAETLQQAVREFAGVEWEIAAGKAAPAAQTCAVLSVAAGGARHEQGYSLTVSAGRIDVTASQPAGVFYAVQTLRQLLQHFGQSLPALRCSDQPDYPHRGVLLDISRDKVPTMETLYALVDLFASWKINQLQLYTEHTFAYRNHPVVWAEASPLTGEEILALDAYCRQRFIELVPNQNTFGHMHRWLRHDEYIHLAEITEGAQTPWGTYWEGPYSLSPAHPGSLDLVRDLLDELLPHFSSAQVNVGCDETFDLGKGRSKKRVEQQGFGRVYLDFIDKIYREVKARGKTMQFWGDIIMEHPELTPELPRDAIALEWGYEAEHPFDEHGALFAASGIPFYVCPGTSSWRTLAGRTDNAVENLGNAAENGLEHGAVGYLNTDWGDEGHWQPLPVSYLGFIYGAALAWNVQVGSALDIPAALDRYVFQDQAGKMGRLAYDLGNIYQEPGIFFPNSSVLFNALQHSPDQIRQHLGSTADLSPRLQATLDQIDAIMAALDEADMQRHDADLIRREFTWIADMLRHACRRILWAQTSADTPALIADADRLIAEYKVIWHARNRPGGFKDSVARMTKMRADYASGG